MSVLDVLEIWVASVARVVAQAGGTIAFSRSTADRLNESGHVVIVCGRKEAELILWESGEAEHAQIDGDSVMQQHLDDITDQGFGSVLAQLLDALQE